MAGPAEPSRLLLGGRPGSGTTPAVARLGELLRADGVVVTGFLTRELRERGEGVGFTLETLDGRRGMLASMAGAACSRTSASAVDPGWAAAASPHDELIPERDRRPGPLDRHSVIVCVPLESRAPAGRHVEVPQPVARRPVRRPRAPAHALRGT